MHSRRSVDQSDTAGPRQLRAAGVLGAPVARAKSCRGVDNSALSAAAHGGTVAHARRVQSVTRASTRKPDAHSSVTTHAQATANMRQRDLSQAQVLPTRFSTRSHTQATAACGGATQSHAQVVRARSSTRSYAQATGSLRRRVPVARAGRSEPVQHSLARASNGSLRRCVPVARAGPPGAVQHSLAPSNGSLRRRVPVARAGPPGASTTLRRTRWSAGRVHYSTSHAHACTRCVLDPQQRALPDAHPRFLHTIDCGARDRDFLR